MGNILRISVFVIAVLFAGVLFFRSMPHGIDTKHISAQSPLSQADLQQFLPPRIASVWPAGGAKDVLLDIEDPIVVRFESSVSRFYIDFRLDPPVEVAYENNADKTEFRVIPKEPLKDGTEYVLSVAYRPRTGASDEAIELVNERFTTLPPQPTEWSKDTTARLDEAKRLTRAKVHEGKYIDINLASQVMTIFENGKAIESYLVSSGKPGMDTPKGSYQIRNKAPRPWSKAYGLYMPNWMALVPDGKFGIHELPEWPGGYKEGAAHLGRPVSHGCVRLGVGAAKRVYDWTEIGTSVVVY
jgi:lipoprotein-anchoring transpeptidase ErfK/SrfK